jgi:hypothetical protein
MAVPLQPIPPMPHVAVAPPALLGAEYFTDTQWKVWYALMDAVTPSIMVGESLDNKQHNAVTATELDSIYESLQARMTNPPSRADFARFLAERPSETQQMRDMHTRAMRTLGPDAIKQLGGILSLLGYVLFSSPSTLFWASPHEY